MVQVHHGPGGERAEGSGPSTILVISDSFHTLPEAVRDLDGSGHSVHYVRSLTRFQDLEGADRAALAEAEAVVTGRIMTIDREALELAPHLRVLALHTSGTDNVDVAAASERGVTVTNVKGVNAGQCADLAMGLILATTRQILRGDRDIRRGRWAFDLPPSHDVGGATLGVIGLGGIGRALVQRAAGFDMEILVHTRTPDPSFGERFAIEYLPLDELLERADIVSLTASLTPQTRGMIGEEQLRRMKPTAYFVNVARGEMVDERALERALRTGAIAGAGIDVFDREPLLDSPLFELDNVVLTPHLAGLTRSGMLGAARRAARNALRVLAGEASDDAVNAASTEKRGANE